MPRKARKRKGVKLEPAPVSRPAAGRLGETHPWLQVYRNASQWTSAITTSATAPLFTWADGSGITATNSATTVTPAWTVRNLACATDHLDAFARVRWEHWPQQVEGVGMGDHIIEQWNRITNETQEQRAAREAQLAQYTQEQTARHAALLAEHERANGRAEKLLTEHLTPMQLDELRAHGHFHLETIAPSGERRRYRIRRGRHGNIDQVNARGDVVRMLCVHPTMNIPDADTMLAQKLWLECNEPELLRTANITEVRQQPQRMAM